MNREHTNILESIRDGMTVYDRNGDRVGKVEYVQFSDENVATPEAETAATSAATPQPHTLVHDVARAFDDQDLPETLRNRLLHDGYIRIEKGLFKSDRFATPDQISGVNGDEIRLNIDADQLIREDME